MADGGIPFSINQLILSTKISGIWVQTNDTLSMLLLEGGGGGKLIDVLQLIQYVCGNFVLYFIIHSVCMFSSDVFFLRSGVKN